MGVAGEKQIPPSTDGSPILAPGTHSPPLPVSDTEKQASAGSGTAKTSAFKALGWLDRFLAVWILLSMVLGVLLGNFVPETGPALRKGKFADVSVPIGMCRPCFLDPL